jgi:nucleoside-diphosphate-sugar epimerase
MTAEITPVQTMTVFITGAMTTVGQALIRRLASAGHHVYGVADSASEGNYLRALGATPAYPDLYRAGELRSAIQGTQAKCIVNLAPQAANDVPQVNADWDARLGEAAAALAQAAAQAGAEYLVHTSYAFADAQADEHSAAARPVLKAVRAAERAALAGPVPASVLRLGTVYGAESAALQALAKALRAGRMIHPGSHEARAWVYAADAAAAIEAALIERPAGKTISVTDGALASPVQFLQYFAEAQGLAAPARPPLFMPRSPFSAAHAAITHLHAAPASAGEGLHWQPRFASFRQGIDDLLISWRAAEAM